MKNAVLLRPLYVNDICIQMGSIVNALAVSETSALIKIGSYAIHIPRHYITIVPPDSPRVHKHKKTDKHKKNVQ